MKNVFAILFCLCVASLALAEPVNAKGETHNPGPLQTGLFINGDSSEGEANVYYDDGTFESDVDTQGYSDPGNKFDNPWTAYYCKAVNVYVLYQSGSFWLTCYTGYNATANSLTGQDYDLTGTGTNSNTWVYITNPTPSASDWINDTANTFNNTMWIGNDDDVDVNIGIDTNGGNYHGFYTTTYSGANYNEISQNLGIRATFAGDSVPVELMEFSAE